MKTENILIIVALFVVILLLLSSLIFGTRTSTHTNFLSLSLSHLTFNNQIKLLTLNGTTCLPPHMRFLLY